MLAPHFLRQPVRLRLSQINIADTKRQRVNPTMSVENVAGESDFASLTQWLMQNTKDERLQELLKQTDDYLQQLGALLQEQKQEIKKLNEDSISDPSI